MISTSNLSMRFPDKKLFEDVNIKFSPETVMVYIDANGAGKSTLIKLFSGVITQLKEK